MGVILSLVQIVVYFHYKRKYPTISEKAFSSTIGIESTSTDNVQKEESPIQIDENNQKGKEKPVKIISKLDN